MGVGIVIIAGAIFGLALRQVRLVRERRIIREPRTPGEALQRVALIGQPRARGEDLLHRVGLAGFAGAIIALVGVTLTVTGLVQYEDAQAPSAQTARTIGIVNSASITHGKCTNTASFTVDNHPFHATTRVTL